MVIIIHTTTTIIIIIIIIAYVAEGSNILAKISKKLNQRTSRFKMRLSFEEFISKYQGKVVEYPRDGLVSVFP